MAGPEPARAGAHELPVAASRGRWRAPGNLAIAIVGLTDHLLVRAGHEGPSPIRVRACRTSPPPAPSWADRLEWLAVLARIFGTLTRPGLAGAVVAGLVLWRLRTGLRPATGTLTISRLHAVQGSFAANRPRDHPEASGAGADRHRARRTHACQGAG